MGINIRDLNYTPNPVMEANAPSTQAVANQVMGTLARSINIADQSQGTVARRDMSKLELDAQVYMKELKFNGATDVEQKVSEFIKTGRDELNASNASPFYQNHVDYAYDSLQDTIRVQSSSIDLENAVLNSSRDLDASLDNAKHMAKISPNTYMQQLDEQFVAIDSAPLPYEARLKQKENAVRGIGDAAFQGDLNMNYDMAIRNLVNGKYEYEYEGETYPVFTHEDIEKQGKAAGEQEFNRRLVEDPIALNAEWKQNPDMFVKSGNYTFWDKTDTAKNRIRLDKAIRQREKRITDSAERQVDKIMLNALTNPNRDSIQEIMNLPEDALSKKQRQARELIRANNPIITNTTPNTLSQLTKMVTELSDVDTDREAYIDELTGTPVDSGEKEFLDKALDIQVLASELNQRGDLSREDLALFGEVINQYNDLTWDQRQTFNDLMGVVSEPLPVSVGGIKLSTAGGLGTSLANTLLPTSSGSQAYVKDGRVDVTASQKLQAKYTGLMLQTLSRSDITPEEKEMEYSRIGKKYTQDLRRMYNVDVYRASGKQELEEGKTYTLNGTEYVFKGWNGPQAVMSYSWK